MDHEVAYDLMIKLPINEETTQLYSKNEEMTLMAVEHAIRKIEIITERDGFISLERIMKILEFRACYETPHIFFDSLEDWELEEQGDLRMELTFSFYVNPIVGNRHKKQRLELVENLKEESGEESWTPSKQAETSESGENGKT